MGEGDGTNLTRELSSNGNYLSPGGDSGSISGFNVAGYCMMRVVVERLHFAEVHFFNNRREKGSRIIRLTKHDTYPCQPSGLHLRE